MDKLFILIVIGIIILTIGFFFTENKSLDLKYTEQLIMYKSY